MRKLASGKRPLVGYLILVVAIAAAFAWSEMRYRTLVQITGEGLCRQVAQSDAFKPTKDIPRSLIESSIANYQSERHDLGLSPCPRKERHAPSS